MVKILCCREEKMQFINCIFKEYGYCTSVMKKHFNKNLVMTAEENKQFEKSNIFCIKLIDFDKKSETIVILLVNIEVVHIGVVISTLKLVKKFL